MSEVERVPEGMTAEKLRRVARYITSADSLVEKVLRNARAAGANVPDEAFEFVTGKEMQVDLYAWADALDLQSTEATDE